MKVHGVSVYLKYKLVGCGTPFEGPLNLNILKDKYFVSEKQEKC
jgi:hypothetical protein